MKIGVPRETYPGERRVALVPAVIPGLLKAGFEVVVEAGAGTEAAFPDADYVREGRQDPGRLAPRFSTPRTSSCRCSVMARTTRTGKDDLPLLRPDQVLIGFLRPLGIDRDHSGGRGQGRHVVCRRAHAADDRAQSMDALSSMATIAGYKAVVIAADKLPRLFPMLTTAAGTITPARVLVIGAGVAGLQAIATARRLGAVASAYDLRPASKEQVQSLGGASSSLPVEAKDAQDARGYARAQDDAFYERQRELLGQVVAESDVVDHGRGDPRQEIARAGDRRTWSRRMAPGSVIVDLAAERGGNCELTRPGELIVVKHGVTIVGWLNLASTVPYHASQMYARNVTAFLLHLVKDGKLRMDLTDEIIRETLLTTGGEVVNARVREFFALPPLPAEPQKDQ